MLIWYQSLCGSNFHRKKDKETGSSEGGLTSASIFYARNLTLISLYDTKCMIQNYRNDCTSSRVKV